MSIVFAEFTTIDNWGEEKFTITINVDHIMMIQPNGFKGAGTLILSDGSRHEVVKPVFNLLNHNSFRVHNN